MAAQVLVANLTLEVTVVRLLNASSIATNSGIFVNTTVNHSGRNEYEISPTGEGDFSSRTFSDTSHRKKTFEYSLMPPHTRPVLHFDTGVYVDGYAMPPLTIWDIT